MQRPKDKYGINQYSISSTCDLVSCYETINPKNYCGYKDNNPIKTNPKDMFFGAIRIIDGSCNLLSNGVKYHLVKNDLFFVKYFRGFQFVQCPESCHFYIHWFYIKNFSLPYYEIFNFPISEEESKISQQIIELLRNHDYTASGIANSLMQINIFRWLKQIDDVNKQKGPNVLDEIIQYINTNLSAQLTISQIATKFYYSDKYIRILFNKNLGISPKKYILQLLMNKAVFLLYKTTFTISEISDELGFENVSSFSVAFKKYYNQNPLTYRKTSQN